MAVPANGAYLGAWVDPASETSSGKRAGALGEEQQLPTFNQSVGRALALYSIYTSFTAPPPLTVLQTLHTYGSTPFISWTCGNVTSVVDGSDDSTITSYAQDLKSFGHPVLLRWYWEMNNASSEAAFNKGCDGDGNPTQYVAAWQHIWELFQQVGADNVAFVWNPSAHPDPSSYYPGDQYVDWIGVDGYDEKGTGTTAFATLFGAFYDKWSVNGKPILIGETGAHAQDQAQYLEGIQSSLSQRFPDIKGIVYWDGTGTRGQWELQGSGLEAFKAMAMSSYFSST